MASTQIIFINMLCEIIEKSNKGEEVVHIFIYQSSKFSSPPPWSKVKYTVGYSI